MAVAYDPKLPSLIADPYPVFRQLREEDPLHRSQVLGGVVLTRYADVKACLNDPRLSSDRITPFVKHRPIESMPPRSRRLAGCSDCGRSSPILRSTHGSAA